MAMINPEELAICRKRGHDPRGHRDKWERCDHCGMWTRTIETREEREDEPPEEEQATKYALDRLAREIKEKP
jgi:hypothetical protein